MNKIKQFFSFIRKPKLPEWMDRRTLILLIIATIFLLTLTLSEPLQRPHFQGLTTLPGVVGSPTPEITSSLPPEWETNSEQTNGIMLGGVVLVLIIVIGSLSVMRSKPNPE